MSKKGEFCGELDSLYRKRTYWLRWVLGAKKPGPPPAFNRKKVDRGIEKLQTIALDALANKLARKEFSKYASSKHAWHVKGHGYEKKRKRFEQWFQETIDNHSNCVYVLWAKKKCIYVGRTGRGGGRPTNHFNKFWFGSVRRIDVYPTRQPSQLPKLECLAIHRFLPCRNKSKAAKRRWTKKCPMCKIHKNIDKELRRIFRFK